MRRLNSLFAVLALAAAVAVVPVANAQNVHFIAAGSSAMWQGFAIAAFNDVSAAAVTACQSGGHTCVARHWTTTTANGNAYVKDSRTNSSGTAPLLQFGNTWIVWVQDTTAGTTTDVWAYVSVDSTVGVRTYLAAPRAKVVLAPGASGSAGAAKIAANLFTGNAPDSPLDATAFAAVNGQTLTAGMTDIRPEDALLATNRSLGSTTDGSGNPGDTVPEAGAPYGAPYWDIYSFELGYGAYNAASTAAAQGIGQPILSGEPGSGANAQPVLFALPGLNDPFSGAAVPNTITVYPVGESPIIFAVNRSNANGLGQVIASYQSLGNCYGAGLTSCQKDNTGQPAGYTSDGSYYVRNVWDQHPWPSVAGTYPDLNFPSSGPCSIVANQSLPECHVTRRPLGNLFTGGDCEGDSSAFTWPLDPSTQGLRAQVPNRQIFPINLFLREALSGTYNTTEYTVIRRYGQAGSNVGSGGTFERPAYVSQESNVIQPGDSALNKQCGADFGEVNPANEGSRIRGIGTGEVLNGPGAPNTNNQDGLQFTPDSLAYAFWSFGNFSKLAKNTSYGYLTIDGIDPLFQDYSNSVGNPGQPAAPGAPLTWGEFPSCTPGAGGLGCDVNSIWGANPSYPHLRDGSYPAWSELRLICDTAVFSCNTDPTGAVALLEHIQDDIHNAAPGSVADFLPFGQDGTFGAGGYGDVGFIRDHFSYVAAHDAALHAGTAPFPTTSPTTNHQSNVQVVFTCNGGTPVDGPTPVQECGGDVGGAIVAAGTAAAAGNLQ
jgi:hypothetical protein